MANEISLDLLDLELLELAANVLSDVGYGVARSASDGFELLLAEDQDSVVALTTVVSAAAVLDAEPAITRYISERFAQISSNPKRWDGYAMVLTSSSISAELAEPIFALTYNLSHVRRIIRVNVEATKAGMRRALRPVLPLSVSADPVEPSDPITSLQSRLITDGVPADEVSRAMSEFRAQQSDNEASTHWPDAALDHDLEEDRQ